MSLIRHIWLLWATTSALLGLGLAGVTLWQAQGPAAALAQAQVQAQVAGVVNTWQHQAVVAKGAAPAWPSPWPEAIRGLRLLAEDGRLLAEQGAASAPAEAPAWFASGWDAPLAPVRQAFVWQGQRFELEAQAHPGRVAHVLWQAAGPWWLGMGLLLALSAAWVQWLIGRIRRPMQTTLNQARALMERRFTTAVEPETPEWRDITRAMNTTVERLKTMFDEQASQVDALRRLAHCDGLTGLSNRAHFMSRLKVMLNSEDGSSGGALLLVRLCELQRLNRQLGRVATDALLRQASDCLQATAVRWPGHEAGRLNGSDFALVLPDVQTLREPAVDLAARLRTALREQGVVAVVSAVRWWHGAPMSSLLAAADHALAHAESRGQFAVEIDDAGEGALLGEDAWRSRLDQALAQRHLQLVEYPVVDLNGSVVHRECPLRLWFTPDTALVPAAEWLPRARRAQLTTPIDLMAVELALQAIEADGMSRAVNLCTASLLDSALMPGLRRLLAQYAAVAPGLWLEITEAGAHRQLLLFRELVALAHAHGALVGLEHAGELLSDVGGLLETGLDFVKLDASLIEGLASDAPRTQHVASTVRMLRGISVKVYAEGVSDSADAQVLWDCGLDGITGPLVQA